MRFLRSETDLFDLPEPFERRVLVQDVLVPGTVAGSLATGVSVVAACATSAVLGHPWSEPLRLMAGVFWRQAATSEMGSAAALLGLLVHGGGAVALGIAFALLVPRGGHTATALVPLGILAGLAMYVVLGTLLVDFMDPPLARAIPSLAMLPFDLLVGACLPVIAPVRRALDAYVQMRHRWVRRSREVDEFLSP